MKVLFHRENDVWTGQIVLRDDGKYVVRNEGVLTCTPWDRAGIDGPYWETIAVCDSFDEAKAVVLEREWPGVKSDYLNRLFIHPYYGTKCYELPDHSYFSHHYMQSDGERAHTYTYIREPIPGSTTVYDDRPCGYVVIRDDVEIIPEKDGSVTVIWDAGKECPIK